MSGSVRMANIIINYTGKLGGALTRELRSDATELFMWNMGVTSIDLTSISECKQLQKLVLSSNNLKEIDLTPLSYCSNLNVLQLSHNDISQIDLSPLFFCPNLGEIELGRGVDLLFADSRLKPLLSQRAGLKHLEIWLGRSIRWKDEILPPELVSRLERINTQQAVVPRKKPVTRPRVQPPSEFRTVNYTGKFGNPLTFSFRLDSTELVLSRMGITSIDLTPFSNCLYLEKLSLSKNSLEEVDISPLFFIPSLTEVDLDIGVNTIADSRIEFMLTQTKFLASVETSTGRSMRWKDEILTPELVDRLKGEAKTVPAPSIEQIPPTSVPPKAAVEILRGGEIVGGKFDYKVKIKNDSRYVITNVTVNVVAYPQDCMKLTVDSSKTIARIEPAGFRSPQFTFLPTKDCVEGQILVTVSYIDHENNLQLTSVEPYIIRSVCDLLVPLEQSPEVFEKLIIDMERTSEERVLDWNPQVLFSKAQKLLPIKNFHVIDSESRIIGGQFTGTIRGFAEGKYTSKKVAVQALVTGSTDGNQSTVVVEGLGEDVAMLPTTIEEISNGIGSWICMNCGAAIDVDGVAQIKQNTPIQCQYCKQTLTIDLYRK